MLTAATLAAGLAAAGPTAAASSLDKPRELADLAAAVAAACAVDPMVPGDLRRAFPGGRLLEARADPMQGRGGRSRHRMLMPSGGEWLLSRVYPGGRLRRVTAEWHAPTLDGRALPALSASAGADCRITEGRRLIRVDGGMLSALEVLAPDLRTVVASEPLNPPVPPPPAARQSTVDGPRVAVIDTGVNYTLPLYRGRLARDAGGRLIGHDYWDMDDRPFDVDAARSVFFPLRHGTAVSSIVLTEAPEAQIMPYRYPRPDMTRFAEMIAHADRHGAVIVNLAMGSNKESDWRAFAAAATARPHMLFIVSAGNDGRDIDRRPVYPAALDLANILTVTSADASGRLARGSNWGAEAVDIMVPGEQVAVTDHRGASGKASGASFAVPRVAALAARLLAKHPDWRAPELKQAILKRARAPFARGPRRLAHGWIPDPTDDFEP